MPKVGRSTSANAQHVFVTAAKTTCGATPVSQKWETDLQLTPAHQSWTIDDKKNIPRSTEFLS